MTILEKAGVAMFFVPEIIEKKKRGLKLSREEIEFIVNGYVKGTIPDYQISALLMAIYFKGMDEEETTNLTMAMANSEKWWIYRPLKELRLTSIPLAALQIPPHWCFCPWPLP